MLLVLGLAGCGSSESPIGTFSSFDDTDQREMIVVDGTPLFTDVGLISWVSFSDAVAVVTLTGERQFGGAVESGESYVGRIIDVHVDEILWQPAHSLAELAQDATIEMSVFGWSVRGDRLIPMAARDAPRLEVGGQYVMPLVAFARGWGPMTATSPLPVASSSIAVADAEAWRAQSPAAAELADKSIQEMRAMLTDVAPDPIAARYFHLPPEERVQAVNSETQPD